MSAYFLNSQLHMKTLIAYKTVGFTSMFKKLIKYLSMDDGP